MSRFLTLVAYAWMKALRGYTSSPMRVSKILSAPMAS